VGLHTRTGIYICMYVCVCYNHVLLYIYIYITRMIHMSPFTNVRTRNGVGYDKGDFGNFFVLIAVRT